jgi:hypothetical protein
MEWFLEILLVVLLTATLFHAVRLERALGVLKRDRGALEELVDGFNSSTRAAEQSVARLHATADGAGRQIARQIELGQALREDLRFLSERGERVADRLEQQVRGVSERPRATGASAHPFVELPQGDVESRYFGDGAGRSDPHYSTEPPQERHAPATAAGAIAEPRVRSQAERDLLRALRMAR